MRIIQEDESTQINLILITYIVAQTEAYISEARKILKRVQGYQSQPELMMLSAQDFSFLKDPKKIILHWEEIKQTRHLLLHTNGLIDSDYIAKSGEIARGTLGTQIEVSRDYLEYCMKITKSLIGKIASHFKLKH